MKSLSLSGSACQIGQISHDVVNLEWFCFVEALKLTLNC